MTNALDDAQVRTVLVGGLSHAELLARFTETGVLLNTLAETLLAEALGEGASEAEAVSVVERSVRELGLTEGGTLPEIYDRAESEGLRLCPSVTAAYMRLVTTDQASAPDSVLSSGRAPTGSLRLREDDDFPAGLYLRVIDGQLWLRGYTCDDRHVWSADDRFVFRTGDSDRTLRTSTVGT